MVALARLPEPKAFTPPFIPTSRAIGPFTTSELNTRGGLRRHGELIGPVYARIGVERAAENPWTPETIDRVATEIERALPHSLVGRLTWMGADDSLLSANAGRYHASDEGTSPFEGAGS